MADAWCSLTTDQWGAMGADEWAGMEDCPPAASRWGAQRGYYVDPETELYLLGGGADGRYYDPAAGRFLSEDPIRFDAGDANLYRYVNNNPINRIDPSGRRDESFDNLAARLEAVKKQRALIEELQRNNAPRDRLVAAVEEYNRRMTALGDAKVA